MALAIQQYSEEEGKENNMDVLTLQRYNKCKHYCWMLTERCHAGVLYFNISDSETSSCDRVHHNDLCDKQEFFTEEEAESFRFTPSLLIEAIERIKKLDVENCGKAEIIELLRTI